MRHASIKENLVITSQSQGSNPALQSGEGSQTQLEQRETAGANLDGITQTGYHLNGLTILRVIGTGSYAKVRLVQDVASSRVMALKTMTKASLAARKSIQRAKDEKSILSKLHHSLVVDFHGSFQDPKHVHLLMDYVPGGELYSLLAKKGRFGLREAKFYVSEVAAAFSYLHSEGIVYRDLKPENILISGSGHIKLADFGFAKRLKKGEKSFSLVGTPHCLAPEIVKRCGHGFECDWWTLGILLYELLEGVTPFEAETPYEMYTNIVTKDFPIPKEIDSVSLSFITSLLRKAPEDRLSSSEVLHHSFFAGIEWSDLDRATPPHVPILKDRLDASHFDEFENSFEQDPMVVVDQRVFEGF